MLAHLASLVKPRIVALLCVTGLSAMLAAGGGPVPTLLSFLVAGATIAAGSAALNCYYDRDLDRHMARTADRPLPSGDLSPRAALAFAGLLLVVGSVVALATLPLPSVAFMWLGVLAYAGVYTVLLKRWHPIGVVLGGSAGSFPVLAGWAAVAPLDGAPLLMAALVFVWTPAHAWALAYVYRADFERAGVPTLPAVAGVERVARAVWYWALATVAVAAIGVALAGPVYAAALVAGSPFFVAAYRHFHRTRTERAAVRAFFASNTYLAVLFAGWAASGILSPTPIAVGAVTTASVAIFVWVGRAAPSLHGVAAAQDPLLARLGLVESSAPNPPADGHIAGPADDGPTGPLSTDGGQPESETGGTDSPSLGAPLATVVAWLGATWDTLTSVYWANSVSWRVFKSGALVFLGFFCWAGANVVLSYRPGWTPLYLLLAYGFLLVVYGPIHHLVVIPLAIRWRKRGGRLMRIGRRLPTAMLLVFGVAVVALALNPVGPMVIDFTAALSAATGGDVNPALLCTSGMENGTQAVHCHLDSGEGISRVVVESGGEQLLVDNAPPFDFTVRADELRTVMDDQQFTVLLEDEDGGLIRRYTRSLRLIDDGQIG